MHLLLVGLNHRTAPVELRERLSISKAHLSEALAGLKALEGISECLLLSTCNRTEVYAYTALRSDDGTISGWMSDFCGVPQDDFMPHAYSTAGHKAAEHLFRVAAGIDSMVVGETQVLGQVKEAYAAASEQGATGTVLNSLFQQAASVGKRARTETGISRGASSVGSAAILLAKSIFGELGGRVVLVVGAGKMAELTIEHLTSYGISQVLVTNRTYEKALELAERFDGEPVRFDDMAAALERADIVITSTGAKQPIITREMVRQAMTSRRGRPVFLIDIAVPRDIEPAVSNLDNVFLYNIDDLQAVVNLDKANRRAEIEKVERIVAEEMDEFSQWFRTLESVPIITALREKFEDVRQAEVEKLCRKLSHLSPEDVEAIGAATKSIVNKLSHDPMIRIKEYTTDAEKLQVICDTFGICLDGKDRKSDDDH